MDMISRYDHWKQDKRSTQCTVPIQDDALSAIAAPNDSNIGTVKSVVSHLDSRTLSILPPCQKRFATTAGELVLHDLPLALPTSPPASPPVITPAWSMSFLLRLHVVEMAPMRIKR